MQPKIPHGLVAMSEVSSRDTSRQDTLSAGVYKKLWQAYSTSHLASNDETECRLEHLFWRIWGAQRLSDHLNTQNLDRLILRIKATTVLVKEVTARQSMPEPGNKEEEFINKFQAACVAGTCSLHPTLKRAQPSPAAAHKTTHLLVDAPIGTKITLDPSNSPIATMAAEPASIPDDAGHESSQQANVVAEPTPIPGTANRQGSKKTYLTAARNGRGPRRRPVFNRRKSSQNSIPKTPPRRRSEPTTKSDRSPYEDSYVELGLLQHLSLREEEDQIARDLGREIAPEPKPKPAVPMFDDDFIDERAASQAAKAGPKTSPVPFPRASSLRRPILSPEEFSKVTPSFGVLQRHVERRPGGPQLVTHDRDGDWTDIDAIESTLPVSQPFENMSVHQAGGQSFATKQSPVVPTGTQASLLSSGIKGRKL